MILILNWEKKEPTYNTYLHVFCNSIPIIGPSHYEYIDNIPILIIDNIGIDSVRIA